jgi:hypothetical protein
MQFAADRNHIVHSTRNQELAYLANTLLAGCAIQGRPFTPHEASEAAVAICNLGLENWPTRSSGGIALPDGFLIDHDLVHVFQVGWMVLHKDVCLHAAERLIAVLTALRCDDHHLKISLDTLRDEMAKAWDKGTPWRAHAHLDVIAILDSPTWAALRGLTSECPVMHAAIGASRNARILTINPAAFDFISDNDQIASIREFMRSMPEKLAQ